MRWSLRPVLWLILGITLVSLLFTYYQVGEEKRRLRGELEAGSEAVAKRLQEAVEPRLASESHDELQRALERFVAREHVAGAAVFDGHGVALAATPESAELLPTHSKAIALAQRQNAPTGQFIHLENVPLHVYALPVPRGESGKAVTLALLQDASSIEAQQARIWRDTYLGVLVQLLLIGLTALLVVRWSVMGPVARTAQWLRALRTGKGPMVLTVPQGGLLQPLATEVASLARSLEVARDAAAQEARLRVAADARWTAERLAAHVQKKIEGGRLLVVSNREPYLHRHNGKAIEMIVPASGLVTALEPVLRASEGVWIAHGSGDADVETSDLRGRLPVPPDDPQYTLRRVWLSREEEQGYYFGFANEGLWPLCHIAHTRPVFRAGDWEQYQAVNRKFAEAVVEEMAGVRHPLLLVQDYHFALLPRLVKQECPRARVAIFWHIPWPNPEAFGICPWQRELLDGMLGADLLGFHIQAHCNNFLETVDRALESRIAWERFSVQREGHTSLVLPFPISVGFAEPAPPTPQELSAERVAVAEKVGTGALWLGVGVDRVDYTKGILERFRGVERFFEKYPAYREQFTFVQIGAPSRLEIKRYHDLYAEVEAEAERINARFRNGKWRPIVLRKRHHSHKEIAPFYRAADLCLVTSLHDGMNLVAKEFLAARSDERGVLVLSRFTGASHELPDALPVNPYDAEEMAEAIRVALEMDPAEQRARMQRMRRVVQENNIYRWAGNLITELSDVRLDSRETPRARAPEPAAIGPEV
jgi:trehalose 6-phosphate synthase